MNRIKNALTAATPSLCVLGIFSFLVAACA